MKTRSRPAPPPPPPADAALAWWDCYASLANLWWSRRTGSLPADDARLQQLVATARAQSPFYRKLYSRLPAGDVPLTQLPTVDKAALMKHFDAWCTDRRVRLAGVNAFLSDRTRIAEPYLGAYHVWKSSGTSGTPGIFLQDSHAMAVYEALVLAQWENGLLDARGASRMWSASGRAALVVADGDHFASITLWKHLGHANPAIEHRSFSVLDPMPRLVAGLNVYQPAFLASYPSVLRLLAHEQAAGRLAIAPAIIWSGGEFLGERSRLALEDAFGCRVMNEYGTSECLSIAFGCREGWLHVNSEWVILEAVDAAGRPVPPGELSHTTLVTNLANRVQPIIRYDLGDRVVVGPARCACGSPLPAIRVEGRTDATLEMRTAGRRIVRLAPLALSTVVEEAAGEHRFQVAQVAPDRLHVRFEAQRDASRARIWSLASTALRQYLDGQSLANVKIGLDRHRPRADSCSGKFHAVTVEMPCRPSRRA
ncbi:MAG TPA: hypothetical protein VLT89_11905 [Usitatibacter sp.]|nr:hypothetical protein [Usitatibacter sp.]